MIPTLFLNKNLIAFGAIFVAVIGLYFYIHSLKSDIQELYFKLERSKTELANTKLEAERYKNALDKQSEKIESLKSDIKNKTKILVKWKTLPPRIKYKTITKIREVQSDECKDIKAQLDSIRKFDYNSLY